jgi:hypothetical protein
MNRTCRRFRPGLEPLETRLAPAVKVIPIQSDPNLPPDSILVLGTAKTDRVKIVDFGGDVQVFSGNKQLTNPVSDPVIVRVRLFGGRDTLNYLVPAAGTIVRQVDIAGGAGRDFIQFDDDLTNTQGESFDGVSLNTGSDLSIQINGGGGSGDFIFAKFGEIQASQLSIDVVCGAGDDSVRILFHDADILGSNSIDFDSEVTVTVNLGRAGALGNFCRVDAGEFTASVGGSDVTGSSLDIDIIGGADRDVVTLALLYFTIGNFSDPPTQITFDATLGGRSDYFFFLHDAQNVLHTNSLFRVNVDGGSGNDRLIANKDDIFPGGFITLQEGATFDMTLSGGTGNDQVLAFFNDAISSTTLQIDDNAVFKLRLHGDLGNDRVAATLENDSSLFTSELGIYDVALFGGGGRDRMGLHITDPVPLTYVNGKALLDGGTGVDAIESLVGVNGLVEKVSIP